MHGGAERRRGFRGRGEFPRGAQHARLRAAGHQHARCGQRQRHGGRAHAGVPPQDLPRQRERRRRTRARREKRYTAKDRWGKRKPNWVKKGTYPAAWVTHFTPKVVSNE